jgi:hypothetical protein
VALITATCLLLALNQIQYIADGLKAIAQGVGSIQLEQALGAAVALCLLLSLALIFFPTYRRHTYLAMSPSLIPPVSVYLDAENQLRTEAAIRAFMTFLMKHLNGRRADLLYFLDASHEVTGLQYKTLYRFGFRLVDVPHDPTGEGKVKEAVDKELAMHAYERALLGPPDQEFIIVTGDRDFVSLIYRLSAAGHQVQLWATPLPQAYRALETYLPDVNVLDLAQAISELQMTPGEKGIGPFPVPGSGLSASGGTRRKRPRRRGGSARRTRAMSTFRPQRVETPIGLSLTGEKQLYQAIAETLDAYEFCEEGVGSDTVRNNWLQNILASRLRARLAGTGYGVGNWRGYWIEHLVALGIFTHVPGHLFPGRGESRPEDAARALFVMVKSAAEAAVQDVSGEGGVKSMSSIIPGLASRTADEDAAPLHRLVAAGNASNVTHTRYFVRAARALGLLTFEDVQNNPDLIQSPQISSVEPDVGTGA